jgi:sugar phosphate isomerase/epimerase
MSRPITLFTGQWADLPLETLAQKAASWGYDGLEIACSGDHFDVERALNEDGYVQAQRDLLDRYGLKCFAISNHLVGQCVADALIDARHREILPDRLWGDGDPEGVRRRAADEMKRTAEAAKRFGVSVVTGFTGSPVWHMLYRFPPTSDAMIAAGYREFADRWLPILDAFETQGVRFALEVHPTEIAFDIVTADMALDAVGGHGAFGFNFDPSHFIPQMFDPVAFIERFPDRIFHVHVKDSRVHLDGRNSILGSHLNFGDARRAWDFVSPGHGDLDIDRLIRALNRIGYAGPLSVEWEDSGMDREHGAAEAVEFVRKADFTPSAVAFDAAFAKQQGR